MLLLFNLLAKIKYSNNIQIPKNTKEYKNKTKNMKEYQRI